MRNLLALLILNLITFSVAWSPPSSPSLASTRTIASSSSSLQVTKLASTAIEEPKSDWEAKYAWFLPPGLAMGAFFSYTETRNIFHAFIDVASGHTWAAADGGQYMANIVRPVLNGPVTLSISVLFGTLVAMTVQTLYNRQTDMRRIVISSIEEVRELQLLVDGFPEPYQTRGKKLLDDFMTASARDLDSGQITPKSIRKKQMGALLLMLNNLSQEPHCPAEIVSQAYGSIRKMKELRSEFSSKLQTVFSKAHYANIVALAATLLFVFLLETDQDAMQFLLSFQLSICWALLIGTFSMLGVVIYDLATPFSGVFQMMQGSAAEMESVRSYSLAMDD